MFTFLINAPFWTSILTWCTCFRYPYYMLKVWKYDWKFLTWLRYTMWIVLYPLGFICEGTVYALFIPIHMNRVIVLMSCHRYLSWYLFQEQLFSEPFHILKKPKSSQYWCRTSWTSHSHFLQHWKYFFLLVFFQVSFTVQSTFVH